MLVKHQQVANIEIQKMENALKMEEKKKRKFRSKTANRWFVDLGDIFFFLVRE